MSSVLNSTGKKEKLLLNICKELSASIYISPIGSRVYLDGSKDFQQSGIKIEYHEFVTPQYRNLDLNLDSNLSIVDVMLTIGIEQTQQFIL